MPTFVVAAFTGGKFVFKPAGAAFNSRHQVFGGGLISGMVQRGRAPHAIWAVAIEDYGHPLTSVQLSLAGLHSASG